MFSVTYSSDPENMDLYNFSDDWDTTQKAYMFMRVDPGSTKIPGPAILWDCEQGILKYTAQFWYWSS